MREELFFVEYIGESMNTVLGHPKGRFVYAGIKKKVGEAMQVAGVQHIEPFERPIEIWYYPLVTRLKSGHISKSFDCLNFGITYKTIEDWLVKFGKLEDDSREFVYGAHMMRAQLAKDDRAGIMVKINELEVNPFPKQSPLELPEQAVF